MNFNELKMLAQRLGGIVVLNGNQPELVVLSYSNYQRLANNMAANQPATTEQPRGESELIEESGEIEHLNKEISALKEEIRQKEEAELAAETPSDNVPAGQEIL